MKMPLKTASLYVHTLRYLKPTQIYARLQKALIKPGFRPAGPVTLRTPKVPWQQSIEKRPSLLGPSQFRFLNEEHTLDDIGWDNPTIAKLWRYNLHYFDDLCAAGAHERTAWHKALIQKWIIENPPTQGSGWEPYTVSLRIVNWIKWLLAVDEPPEGMIQSLADQAGWLSKNLEYHILGNHLFANVKALIFAGCFFDSPEANQWLTTGQTILSRELNEQILADGGHFELSPMYHAIILEDILDLIQLGRCFDMAAQNTSHDLEKIADNMLSWLEVMSHPDGGISFFNDAAFGIAADNEQLYNYAMRLNIEAQSSHGSLKHLKDSGYIRTQAGPWTAFLDVARIGPDYLPGHAHADCLSFELSHGEQRILVNSGISEYGLSEERLRQRGTAAHNTVEINGQDSAEIWSGFRVARRGRPFDLNIDEKKNSCEITCRHNGYKRLRGKPIHKRSWNITPHDITITDEVEGEYQSARAHFHFHPDVDVRLETDSQSGSIQCGNQLIKFEIEGGAAVLQASTYHPEFGKMLHNHKLIVELSSPRLILRLKPS